ncbi:MAG TPA: xanthine dehydrogenase family protein molybdopterin-binding subunit [Chloroflexota bacterium]
MVYSKQVGARVKRKEDPRLITGSASYVDDYQPRRLAHLAILRSIYAHARIKSIDSTAARQLPGVIAVFTGEDFEGLAGPMPYGPGEGGGGQAGQIAVDCYALEDEIVRHVGQAIAAVVAEDRYVARDALDLIEVDYEPLEPVVDPEAALRPGAPQLYDQVPNNICYRWVKKTDDVDAAFATADVVVSQHMTNQKVSSISMETRGVLAEPDPLGDIVTVYTSTQNPHTVRTQIAATLGLPEIAVRVIAPEVGGGFGAKINSYPEEIIVAALALKLRQPIKWIETRSENIAATYHGRAQGGDFSIAAKRDGTVTGVRMRLVADIGAYPRDVFIPTLTGWLLPGVYACKNFDMEITTVYTTTMATGAYRGAGRPEAAYYIERLMDLLADELGMDPVEIRRKNFIPPDAFPYQTPSGMNYDSGEYDKALTKALEIAGYAELRAEQERLRAQGRYLGIGVSTFTEICGFGPFDSANVRVEPSGQVTVSTGVSPHGQGSETSFAQIVADELGVPLDAVVVIHGDTARTPQGIGTMGSRSMAVGGVALYRSVRVVRDKAIRIAAHLLEASADDIELVDGLFAVKGAPGRGKTLEEIAQAAYNGSLPDEIGTGLEALDFYRPANMTFPFGADVVVVEVLPDTGETKILRYIAVDDCGRVISPMLVEGQVHGGLAQGIAQALFEEIVYDESGQLVTGTLMDYAVPAARDLPSFETAQTETPTPINPLGAKGIGELATIGSAPAVVNAVMDALSPFGIRHLDMPLRPERVWNAIQAAKAKG